MLKKLLKFPPAFQLNIVFFLLMSFLVMIFSYKIPNAINFLVIFFSLVFFQIFLCLVDENKFLNLIKIIIFPVFSVLIAFDTVGVIIPHINSDLDYIFLSIDYKIFGFYPYVYLERFVNPFLTEIMQLSYCIYYFLPFILGFYLLKNGSRADYQKALFLVLLCYYLSYIGYILFPALGPRFSISHLFEVDLKGILFAHEINDFLNKLEGIKRDAFPSGHVGISLLILIIISRYSKKLFLLLLIPVTLLIISTVYCRYHYFIDVVGGFILTVVTLLLGDLYYNFWLKKNEDSPSER